MSKDTVGYVDPTVNKVPNYEVSDKAFLLTQANLSELHEATLAEVMAAIEEEEMAPYYKYLCEEYLPKGTAVFDNSLYSRIAEKNKARVAEFKTKIEELERKDEGELEQIQVWIQLGEYYAQIGDRENAIKILREKCFEKAMSSGAKIDILLTVARVGFFYNDYRFVKEILDQIDNGILEKGGGDWERRNRYKTYRGIYCMAVRQWNEESANLLVDSLSTFTCTELTSYTKIATYASIVGLYSFERTDLKNKIVDSSEILSLLYHDKSDSDLDIINSLTISLYTSDYASFLPFLLQAYEMVMTRDKICYKHANFFVREMRRKVYSQLLDSYKTLSLRSMASQFGVSVEWLDQDLSRFISNSSTTIPATTNSSSTTASSSNNKLNCIIDRVNGIVETNRPDNKNAQFNLLIKQGDTLLTKLQKYSNAVKLTNTSNTAASLQ